MRRVAKVGLRRSAVGKLEDRVFAYTVEGAGTFPFDMLRYDQAWPAFQGDSAAAGVVGQRRVELRGLKLPTSDRWASFGWKVVREAGPDQSPHEVVG